MENINIQTVKQVTESVSVLLRYIASGFIAVLAYIFLYTDYTYLQINNAWVLVILAASIGLITYALHISLLDKLFYKGKAYRLYEQYAHKCENIKNAIAENAKIMNEKNSPDCCIHRPMTKSEYIFILQTQTYLRNASLNDTVKHIQRQMEQRLSLLAFLYCTLYQIIILIVYFLVTKFVIPENNEITSEQAVNCSFLIIGVCILVAFTHKFDYRICRREIWAIAQFYQSVPSQSVTQQDNMALSSITQTQTGSGQSKTIKTLLDVVKQHLDTISKDADNAKKIIG